jgi:hypothetical protein
MFKRRIGPHPHFGPVNTSSLESCPDIWELESGEFAIIGRDKTGDLKSKLPSDASCGPDERIVVIDRHVLVRAKIDIPEQ